MLFKFATIIILLPLVHADDADITSDMNFKISEHIPKAQVAIDAYAARKEYKELAEELIKPGKILDKLKRAGESFVKNAKALTTPVIGLVGVVMNEVLNYIYPDTIQDISNVIKDTSAYIHNSYVMSMMAVDEIQHVRGIIKEANKNLDDAKDIFMEEMEKMRGLLLYMTELQEETHQETMQSMHGIQEGITTVSKAVSLINQRLFPVTGLDVDLFVKKLTIVFERLKKLEFVYKDYLKYLNGVEKYNKKTLDMFIHTCMSVKLYDERNLISIINMQHLFTNPEDGIFFLIADEMVERYILASRKISSLQFLHNTFALIMITEIRIMFVVDFAYHLSYYLNPDSTFDQEYNDYVFQTSLRINWMVESFKFNSQKLSGRQWVLDTYKNIIGNQYVFFTNFMKGIIYRDTSCSNAGNLPTSDYNRKSCQLENIHTCSGRVHCDSSSSANMYICYSSEHVDRRYDYVLLKSDQRSLKCHGKKVMYNSKANCQDCLCFCDEPDSNYTDRYISLDEMVSNVTELRIITGVRLSKHNGVIGIDIRETQLSSYGGNKKNSSEWITNKGKRSFKLRYPDKLFINVGEINLDELRVVTGVRFAETKDGVELQVKLNEYVVCNNVTSFTKTFVWTSRSENNFNSDFVDLRALDLPTAAAETGLFMIKSFSDQRIRVSSTNFATDGAQSVLPFFDTRPVYTIPPVPLRGIGLAYKSPSHMYGGYIAPYLVVADLSKKIDTELLTSGLLKQRSNIPLTTSKTAMFSAEYVKITISCLILIIVF